MKSPFVQNVLHWLLVTSGFLAAIGGFGAYAHFIPGRIGQVLVALFALIFSVERLLIVIESILEGKKTVDASAEEVVKDVEEVSGDVAKLAQVAQPFIKNAPK